MKKIMLGLLLMLGLCDAFAQFDDALQKYLEEHVVIAGTRAREVSKTEYVVELTLKDYQKTSPLPIGFGMEGRVFGDDGRDYDLRRGDGIYTTKEKYTFQSVDRPSLESGDVIYDESFQHMSELSHDSNLQSKISISCDFGKIGCPPPAPAVVCTACRQLGWQCWGISKCTVKFEFP